MNIAIKPIKPLLVIIIFQNLKSLGLKTATTLQNKYPQA